MFTIDTKSATDEIRKQFKSLSDREMRLGISRAINHTLGKTKTASSREIRSIYRLKAKDVSNAFKIDKSYPRKQYGSLLASGAPSPSRYFSPRQTRQGVTINVKGQRKLIRGAFLANVGSLKNAVFARGQYSKSQFEFRPKRIKPSGNDTPIQQLNSVSVPAALSNNAVLNSLSKKITEDYPGRLLHEMRRMAFKR